MNTKMHPVWLLAYTRVAWSWLDRYALVRTDGKDWRRRGILESKLEEMVAPAVAPAPVLSAEGDACRQNAEAAARVQRPELARMWRTLATTFDAMFEDQKANVGAMPYHTPWRDGALGSKLINKTFAHLEACGELQTLAVLTCIMGGPKAAYGEKNAAKVCACCNCAL